MCANRPTQIPGDTKKSHPFRNKQTRKTKEFVPATHTSQSDVENRTKCLAVHLEQAVRQLHVNDARRRIDPPNER